MSNFSRVLPVILLTVFLTMMLAASASAVDVWTDENGHLWAENNFYKWDVTHGSALMVKVGNEWRNWRVAGYESYQLELGDGGGNISSPGVGWCRLSDFEVQDIIENGNGSISARLFGVLSRYQKSVIIEMTFYENSGVIKMTFEVADVFENPRPPALFWRVSLVPGGNVSTNDYYHYSGQGGESHFPYNSWTRIMNTSIGPVGNTDYVYITDYDKDVQQGFAMIAKLQETADFYSDINYGRAQILDYHGYGGYASMSIHANSVVSPTVYWYFYGTDPTTAYQPVEDLITNGGLENLGTMNVSLDIKPGSCPNPLNVKSPGEEWLWIGGEDMQQETDASSVSAAKIKPMPQKKAVLPAAILGTEEFDISQIDPSTILLNSIPVLRWSYEDAASPVGEEAEVCECTDYGPDGYTDLTLKFFRDEIIASLGEVYDGQVIPLTISGVLIDGTPFEGVDCVVILADDENPVASAGNYPNPFNPTTTISFALNYSAQVSLDIFNITGQRVTTLIDSYLETGEHAVFWDGRDQSGNAVASGIYFYRLEADGFAVTKKMVLLK